MSTTKKSNKTNKTAPAVTTVYVIRSCDKNLKSHNGFQWPASGFVECPDWNPEPVCGGGLHGLAWGVGDWSLCRLTDPASKWLVVAVQSDLIVEIDAKVKFPKCEVAYCGDLPGAQSFLAEKRLLHLATLDTSEHSSGLSSASSATGDRSASSATGYRSASSATGDRSASSATGDRSASSATGDRSASSATGKNSVAAAFGLYSRAKGGPGATIIVAWHDAKADRFRYATGYIGEAGIEPETWYEADDSGVLVKSKNQEQPIQD